MGVCGSIRCSSGAVGPGWETDLDDDGWWLDDIQRNDGVDNQCPGDPGFGLVDELSFPVRFESPTTLSSMYQEGATAKTIVRSPRHDFSIDCTVFSIGEAGFSALALFTQAHYRSSIEPDANLSELYKDVFLPLHGGTRPGR